MLSLLEGEGEEEWRMIGVVRLVLQRVCAYASVWGGLSDEMVGFGELQRAAAKWLKPSAKEHADSLREL